MPINSRKWLLRVCTAGLLLGLLGLFAGCSDSTNGSRHGGAANVGGTGGSGAAGTASTGTAGLSGGITINPVDGGGAGSAGSSGAADGGVPETVNIDQCTTGNPAGLNAADVKTLMAGGAPGTLAYVYPYDATVFPRGLIAPMLMWKDADDAQAVYAHIKSKNFEWKGCVKPTAAGQLQLPADVWSKAEAKTQGSTDPFTISLNTIAGGVAKGPITLHVIIAQATLKGSIFYNSYASHLSPGAGSVFRIIPGKDVELFIPGPKEGCNGCHAVSANGTRLVSDVIMMNQTRIFKIEPTTMPDPTPLFMSTSNDSFVGLSPSGDVYLTNSATGGVGVRAGASPMAVLRETDTGTTVAGTTIPTGAMMGTFSPDGSLLAFNDYAIGNGKGLALMDYDAMGRKASKYRMLYTESSADKLPAWPFVLPDNKGIVFQLGTAKDFSGGNVGIDATVGFGGGVLGGLFGGGAAGTGGDAAPTTGPWGNLFVISSTGGTPVMLAKAMGYSDAAGTMSYLPFATDEKDMNYYPTVSPVAAGGYFWVFFDSERHYGNKGLHRQLWGTAVTISADGKYTADPSHPAFYLTGQEFGTGNHRAFTALAPCKAEGTTCTTGIDCCGGFCYIPEHDPADEFGNHKGTCKKPEVKRCSKTDEACKTKADCCIPTDSCIAGFCGQMIVQ